MQKHYTCIGVLNTDEDTLSNLNKLLSSCRGMLAFTGGKYKLRLEQPDSTAFSFNENNIVDAWKILPGSRQLRYGRARGLF